MRDLTVDGRWSWPAAIADVDHVAAALNSAGHSNVRVEFVKGGHGLLFQHPGALAARMSAYPTGS